MTTDLKARVLPLPLPVHTVGEERLSQLIMPFIWIHAVHSEADEWNVCIHALVSVRF